MPEAARPPQNVTACCSAIPTSKNLSAIVIANRFFVYKAAAKDFSFLLKPVPLTLPAE